MSCMLALVMMLHVLVMYLLRGGTVLLYPTLLVELI